VAISVHSDRAVFRNCRFLGMQDTLYAASGRQYYVDSYIAGHVDFIFGNAAAVFDHCQIHSRGTGYVAAESRTMADGAQGFVFTHCRLTADAGVHDVFLGRPWRNYSRVVYLECWMGDHIRPRVGTTGTKKPPNRVRGLPNTPRWSRRQRGRPREVAKPLTAAEAREFRPRFSSAAPTAGIRRMRGNHALVGHAFSLPTPACGRLFFGL